ncbi:MAG: sodium/solute symporter [Planctomycetaceae bacterium]|nr:sodium/solute symporter [Planctomycetaceae bacterium]
MVEPEAVSTAAEGGLAGADHLVIGLYLACMLGMGIYIALKQRSTEDFFVGGRNLPAWAVGISLLASLLSTITYLGMPGEMFRTGLGFLTRQLGIPFVLVVVWFLWLPFFMKLNLTSAYEYLERRFNYTVRAMAGVFCLLLLFGWMAVVVLTASGAMAEIANLNLDWFPGENTSEFRDADMHAIILSVGLFSVLYTTLGGIRAVIWTDVVQFFVLIGGALFTIGFIASQTNSGVGDWIAVASTYEYRESVEWFDLDVQNRSTVFSIAVGMFFWFICTHGANQVALQRYFAVKDAKAARRSYLVSAVASFALGVILAGVGLALIYFIQDHPLPASESLLSEVEKIRYSAQDKIFPQFISIYLPAGLRGMVVAALFAAAMSTIDSGANSVSTIVTVDFFRRLRPDHATPAAELRLARTLTACMGVLIVAITLGLYHLSKGTDIISLCQKGFNCFLGPLGGVFVLAMFFRRATPATVIPALLAGEIFGVCASYSTELFGTPYSTHLVVPGSWIVTIVTGSVLGFVLRTEATPEQQQWMWIPVVAGGSRDMSQPAPETSVN